MQGSTHQQLTCPQCGQHIHRAHRRPIERWVSLVVPLRRYRCYRCNWSGVRVAARRPRIGNRSPREMVILISRLIIIVLFVIMAVVIDLTIAHL